MNQPEEEPRVSFVAAGLSRFESGVDVRHHVVVLHVRLWLIVSVFAAVVLVASVYAFTRTPIYEARSRLLIEVNNPNIVQFQQVLGDTSSSSQDNYYATQYQLLGSRSLARQTLDQLDFWDDPTFLGSESGDSQGLTQAVLASVAHGVRLVGGGANQVTNGEWAQDEETLAESQAIDTFLSNFSARAVGASRLVDISYRSPNPVLATNLIKSHAEAYISQSLEFRFLASRDATDWLSEQLTEQLRAVEKSEAALNEYRQNHDAVSLEKGENIVIQRLAELSAAHTRSKTQLIEKETAYRQVEAFAGDPDALDALPAVMSNRLVQELRAEVFALARQRARLLEDLGDRHPSIIEIQSAINTATANLRGEVDKVLASIRNEFVVAQAQEQSLGRELESQRDEALAMNETGAGYGVLLRDAETNRQFYEHLLQRAKETSVSSELRATNIRIVDESEVSTSPVSPNKRLMLIIATVVGAIGSIGIAFLVERLDGRVQTPEDLRAHLHLPSLGGIPAVPSKELQSGQPLLLNLDISATFSEALRKVRTAVLCSSRSGNRLLVITSAGPGEGKSVVSANLAVGLAEMNQTVLLVDGDMRHPTAHKLCDCDQEPGLSNLLAGEAKSEDALRATSVPGMWVLPAGKIPPNPGALLSSSEFKVLLDSLSEYFDWVLIDSPPVMPVTDALMVTHAGASVIFVVGAGTSRHAAQDAFEQLKAVNCNFVGGVVNRVDPRRTNYYGSEYYSYLEQPIAG